MNAEMYTFQELHPPEGFLDALRQAFWQHSVQEDAKSLLGIVGEVVFPAACSPENL